jgi:predicted ester cyclase
MSTEENKALVHRLFEEGMNQNQGSVVDQLIATNYVNYDFPSSAPGRQGFQQVIGFFRRAFPDMHVTLEDEIAEGDKVVTRGYFSGTHQGEFQGIAPTGKQIHVKYIDVWRLENGQLVENWVQMDMLGLLQQLGVIPAMG